MTRFSTDGLTPRQAVALIVFLVLLCGGVVAFKAWLLTLVLGWIGVIAFGFWKAVVAVLLLDLLLASARSSK